MKRRALVIVDAQNDFMPGGKLAVPGGDEIVPVVETLLTDYWQLIVFTRDLHPKDHCSFEKQGGKWPPHCVVDTPGAALHDDLAVWVEEKSPDWVKVVNKGKDSRVESYSAFFYANRDGQTLLDGMLKERKIDEIVVCGLATDYCVKATVLDALGLRIPTTVLIDACRAVNVSPLDEKRALIEMVEAGACLAISGHMFR